MKKILLTLCLVWPAIVIAQRHPPMTEPFNNAMSFQLEAGTQGVGGDVRYGLLPNLSGRLGASFAPLNANSSMSISGFNTMSSESVNFANVHLLADFVPFENAQGIRLVGGAAYLYHATGHLELSPTGNYTFGNYNLSGADVGILDMNVVWNGIAPYAGIGLFKSFPSNFFNFNLDLGTYYLTAPSTHITGTNLLVDNNQLEPQFNQNLKSYRWLPVLQLNFNFRIKQ